MAHYPLKLEFKPKRSVVNSNGGRRLLPQFTQQIRIFFLPKFTPVNPLTTEKSTRIAKSTRILPKSDDVAQIAPLIHTTPGLVLSLTCVRYWRSTKPLWSQAVVRRRWYDRGGVTLCRIDAAPVFDSHRMLGVRASALAGRLFLCEEAVNYGYRGYNSADAHGGDEFGSAPWAYGLGLRLWRRSSLLGQRRFPPSRWPTWQRYICQK